LLSGASEMVALFSVMNGIFIYGYVVKAFDLTFI